MDDSGGQAVSTRIIYDHMCDWIDPIRSIGSPESLAGRARARGHAGEPHVERRCLPSIQPISQAGHYIWGLWYFNLYTTASSNPPLLLKSPLNAWIEPPIFAPGSMPMSAFLASQQGTFK